MIKNLPKDNNKFYMKHVNGSNKFTIKQIRKQCEKEDLLWNILNMDKKLAGSKNKANVAKFKRQALDFWKELGEEFVDLQV